MEGHAAALCRHAGLVQRALQLRLIAQQQRKGFGLLDGDLDARRRVGWTVDAHLHATEFGRVQSHRQPLRAIGHMAAATPGRAPTAPPAKRSRRGQCVVRGRDGGSRRWRTGRRAGGPASIAIGEEECADGETGAPSAVSRPAGAAVVMISGRADPACVGVTAASGPWLAGVLVAERAVWTSAARGSATASADGGVRKSTVGVAAARTLPASRQTPWRVAATVQSAARAGCLRQLRIGQSAAASIERSLRLSGHPWRRPRQCSMGPPQLQ